MTKLKPCIISKKIRTIIIAALIVIIPIVVWIAIDQNTQKIEQKARAEHEQKVQAIIDKTEISKPEQPNKIQQKSKQVKGNDVALKAILAEPKVKDAVITDAGVLYVGVLDDGTRRDGYAEYLCIVIKDYRTTVTRIKVMKYNSFKDPNRDNVYGVLLGEAWCR